MFVEVDISPLNLFVLLQIHFDLFDYLTILYLAGHVTLSGSDMTGYTHAVLISNSVRLKQLWKQHPS